MYLRKWFVWMKRAHNHSGYGVMELRLSCTNPSTKSLSKILWEDIQEVNESNFPLWKCRSNATEPGVPS